MHIELTDHLRCPRPHAESFLVLLPSRVDARDVIAGQLGCPVCGWEVTWDDGVPVFGEAAPDADGVFPFDAGAAIAMLGIDGPGGWIALSGSAASIAGDLGAAAPGVHVVMVNPPLGCATIGGVSTIRSPAWPLKSASMRGLVLGGGVDDPGAAVASVLPGLRACGSGEPPAAHGMELVASAGDAWVVRRR